MNGALYKYVLLFIIIIIIYFRIFRHDAYVAHCNVHMMDHNEVFSKSDKSFRVQIGNREEPISIDHLNPAHLNSENLPPVA